MQFLDIVITPALPTSKVIGEVGVIFDGVS